MMTSTWANGADTFVRFFMPKEQAGRVQMLNVDFFMQIACALARYGAGDDAERIPAGAGQRQIPADRCAFVPYPDGSPASISHAWLWMSWSRLSNRRGRHAAACGRDHVN